MPTFDEVARDLPRKSALAYLATPSALQFADRWEEHVDRCRARAIEVGLPQGEAERILVEVRREAVDTAKGLDWIDAEYARRLYAAVAELPD